MEKVTAPSTAPDIIKNGKELADFLYQQHVETAKTVSDVRAGVKDVLKKVGSDGEAGERAKEIETAVGEATENGHDDVRLEDNLGSGVLGTHNLQSGEATLMKDQFSPEAIVKDTRRTLGVVVEEDKEGVGHPGQDRHARVNVIYGGKKMTSTAA